MEFRGELVIMGTGLVMVRRDMLTSSGGVHRRCLISTGHLYLTTVYTLNFKRSEFNEDLSIFFNF